MGRRVARLHHMCNHKTQFTLVLENAINHFSRKISYRQSVLK